MAIGAHLATSFEPCPFEPWHDYATTQGLSRGLYCGSETINTSPAYVMYYGGSKSAMEAQQTDTSNTYTGSTDSVFLRHVIHDYTGCSTHSDTPS
jgi:hypothetical protein